MYRSPLDIATDVIRAPGQTGDSLANNMIVPERSSTTNTAIGSSTSAAAYRRTTRTLDEHRRFRGAALEQLNPDESQPVVFGPGRFDERRDTLNTPVTVETSALLLLGLGVAIAGGVAVVLLFRAEQRGYDRDVPVVAVAGL